MTEFKGFHQFDDREGNLYGSFEVFHADGEKVMKFFDVDPELVTADECTGWYWWSCFPGCLPDGEPNGPYETAEEAYIKAQEI